MSVCICMKASIIFSNKPCKQKAVKEAIIGPSTAFVYIRQPPSSEPLELSSPAPQAPLYMGMPTIKLVEVMDTGAPLGRQPG